jgi:4-hydroxy-tetrahydrodipicolinate synthase
MDFGRVLTAMVTPFDIDGKIDFKKTEALVNHLIANGTDGLVVSGTTGESPTLTTNEKLSLIQFVVDKVNGRVPVIAGTGSNSTAASVELTRQAGMINVDGVMLVTPYYNKPSQEGLYQHFKTIAEATTLPVMLYNVPGRTAVGLAPETIIRLSEIDNIVTVKEASGDLDAMAKVIQETDESFTLYSGDDSLTLPVLSIGGHGIVSIASHIIGNDMQEMIRSFLAGDHVTAAQFHRSILPTMKAMFIAPSPSPVKEALNMIGVNVGSVRLPMMPLNQEQKQQLELELQAIRKYAAS